MTKFLEAISRITPATVLVRGLVFVFTFIALVLAIPSFMFGVTPLSVAALAALVTALAPGTRMVTIVLAAGLFGWVAGWLGRLGELSAVQLVLFGSVLFLAHSSASLAALIPFDAVVSPEVLLRWYLRAFAIAGGSALVGLVLIVGASLTSGINGTALASLAGLAAAAGLIAVLVRLLRRRTNN
ncbi:hypothetical protein [Hamadaea tsunoensis]|uniref:hypothetical protein n=1 Tax=Hamadaea tsunoensis TaxID=53368 RepID=UPI000416FAC4|nr:hypothetical protein [Hamadaea tsunoensis]